MRTMFAFRSLLLMLGLAATCPAVSVEPTLELPPPLELNLAPGLCEAPATLSDLSLQTAVQIALCKAPRVRQAHLSIEEELANLRTAHAKYLPTLGANADANRIGKRVKYPDHTDANHSLHTNSGNARLGLSWLLFDSGRRDAQYDNAHARLTGALYSQVLANRDRAVAVADSYYKACHAAVSAEAARQAVSRAKQSLQATQRLREGGVGSLADEQLAKLAWQRNLVENDTKATTAAISRAVLATTIGLPGQSAISLSKAPDSTFRANPTTALRRAEHLSPSPVAGSNDIHSQLNERIITAVRNHPRLAAARASTQAANAEAQAINAQHLPSVTLQADRHTGFTPPASSVAKQKVNGWSVGFTVHIPIFDGHATKHATGAARARAQSARETERSIWLEEELKLLTDVSQMTSANHKEALLKDAEASAQQAYRSAQVRYQEGVGTALELLKALDELAGIQQTAIDVHYELLATRFRVSVALDTLSPARIERY